MLRSPLQSAPSRTVTGKNRQVMIYFAILAPSGYNNYIKVKGKCSVAGTACTETNYTKISKNDRNVATICCPSRREDTSRGSSPQIKFQNCRFASDVAVWSTTTAIFPGLCFNITEEDMGRGKTYHEYENLNIVLGEGGERRGEGYFYCWQAGRERNKQVTRAVFCKYFHCLAGPLTPIRASRTATPTYSRWRSTSSEKSASCCTARWNSLVLAGRRESAPGALDDDPRGPVAGIDALGDALTLHQLGEEAPYKSVTSACIHHISQKVTSIGGVESWGGGVGVERVKYTTSGDQQTTGKTKFYFHAVLVEITFLWANSLFILPKQSRVHFLIASSRHRTQSKTKYLQKPKKK